MEKLAKMPIIHPQACGIDVGSQTHYVATGQGKQEVRSFASIVILFSMQINFIINN